MSLARPGSEWRPLVQAEGRVHHAMVLLGAAALLNFAHLVHAAEFSIPAERESVVFDGQKHGIRPGDTIEIAAGLHGPITFRNVLGSSDRPVVIRNDESGQAVIRRTNPGSGGYVLKLEASKHF